MQRFISSFALVAFAFAHLAFAAQPQIISLSPSSGSGQTQTFTLTVSDSAGAADIASMNLLINSAFTGQGACWIFYDHVHHGLSVANDQGTWGSGGNSQCSAQVASANDSGNQASVSINVTFNAHWTGDRTMWAASQDVSHDDSGYQQVGTFTVVAVGPVPDFSVSITPASQTTEPGQPVFYNVTVTSINGFSGEVDISPVANPQPSGLSIVERGPAGDFRSFVDVPANGTGVVQMEATSTTSTPPTNNITIAATFTNGHIQHVFTVTLNLVPPSAPVLSITPTSGSGSTQTFTITATDPGGYAAIQGVNILLNSSFSGTNGCWLYYQEILNTPGASNEGTLSLASDDATNWPNQTTVYEGSTAATPIHNSQCSVFGGTTTMSGSGNTLTLTITLTFTPSFAGPKLIYVRANDVAGPDSTYQQLGTFTAVGGSTGPDFQVGVSPDSQSVTGQGQRAYVVGVDGVNGYAGTVNLTVTGLPPNSTLIPPASIGPGKATTFQVNTTGSTPTGSYTLTITGTDGTLTHDTTAVLNVTGAAMPVLAVSPNSGTGTTQTFTFIAQGQGGTSDPSYLNVLFNNTVNGQGACWLYYADQLRLASDDGSIWQSLGSNTSISNSQCTISSLQTGLGPADSLGFSVTITFSGSFTGAKNIFMHSTNQQGGDTGYQLQGSWTVP